MTAITSLVAPRQRTSARYALSRFAQRCLRIAIRSTFVLLALVAIAPVVLVAFGYQPTFVHTDGAPPSIDRGDVVLHEVVAQSAVRVGDVITYTDAEGSAAVTERVLDVQQSLGQYSFTTDSTGPQNPAWSPVANEEVARIAYRLPALDNVIDEATSPAARDAFAPAGTAILFLLLVQRGWAAYQAHRTQAGYR